MTTGPPEVAALVGASRGRALVVGVSVKVELNGGLAAVSVTRKFENPEARPIEATLAFPVPALARLFRVEARSGGRLLRARVLSRREAEQAYDQAIGEGRFAARRREMPSGLHLLSLGPLAPKAVVEVTGVYAISLQLEGEIGRLRLPMTTAAADEVPGLEGEEPWALPRADGEAGEAELEVVRKERGSVRLGDRGLDFDSDGCWRGGVPDNLPVDLVVSGWRPAELTEGPAELTGKAADGRTVTMRIEPAAEEGPVNAAVLVDDSASMRDETLSGGGSGPYRREAAWAAAGQVIGEATGYSVRRGFLKNADALLRKVSSEADLVLLTDGRRGVPDRVLDELGERRLFLVLVSGDGFDRGLSRPAIRSGGDFHFAAGAEVTAALRGALAGSRRPKQPRRARITWDDDDRPQEVTAVRGGAKITAGWSGRPEPEPTGETSAVAALVIGLVLDDHDLGDHDEARRLRGERLALSGGVLSPWTAFVLEGGKATDLDQPARPAEPTPEEGDDDDQPGVPGAGEPAGSAGVPLRRAALPAPPGVTIDGDPGEPEPDEGGVAGGSWKDGLRAASAFIVGAAASAWIFFAVSVPLLRPGALGLSVACAAVNIGGGHLLGALARGRRRLASWRKAAATTGAVAVGGALVSLNLLLPWQVDEYLVPPLAAVGAGASDGWEEFDDRHELEDRSLRELEALVEAPVAPAEVIAWLEGPEGRTWQSTFETERRLRAGSLSNMIFMTNVPATQLDLVGLSDEDRAESESESESFAAERESVTAEAEPALPPSEEGLAGLPSESESVTAEAESAVPPSEESLAGSPSESESVTAEAESAVPPSEEGLAGSPSERFADEQLILLPPGATEWLEEMSLSYEIFLPPEERRALAEHLTRLGTEIDRSASSEEIRDQLESLDQLEVSEGVRDMLWSYLLYRLGETLSEEMPSEALPEPEMPSEALPEPEMPSEALPEPEMPSEALPESEAPSEALPESEVLSEAIAELEIRSVEDASDLWEMLASVELASVEQAIKEPAVRRALAHIRMFPVVGLLPGEVRSFPDWWLWGLSPIGLLLAGFSFRWGSRTARGRRRARSLGAG